METLIASSITAKVIAREPRLASPCVVGIPDLWYKASPQMAILTRVDTSGRVPDLNRKRVAGWDARRRNPVDRPCTLWGRVGAIRGENS